jgi:hypothetical protein
LRLLILVQDGVGTSNKYKLCPTKIEFDVDSRVLRTCFWKCVPYGLRLYRKKA